MVWSRFQIYSALWCRWGKSGKLGDFQANSWQYKTVEEKFNPRNFVAVSLWDPSHLLASKHLKQWLLWIVVCIQKSYFLSISSLRQLELIRWKFLCIRGSWAHIFSNFPFAGTFLSVWANFYKDHFRTCLFARLCTHQKVTFHFLNALSHITLTDQPCTWLWYSSNVKPFPGRKMRLSPVLTRSESRPFLNGLCAQNEG